MATITIRVDDAVKQSFAQTCDHLGLDMTSAMMIYIKKVAREHRIPFEVSCDPFYSKSNIEYLEQVAKDIESGKAKLVQHDLLEVE